MWVSEGGFVIFYATGMCFMGLFWQSIMPSQRGLRRLRLRCCRFHIRMYCFVSGLTIWIWTVFRKACASIWWVVGTWTQWTWTLSSPISSSKWLLTRRPCKCLLSVLAFYYKSIYPVLFSHSFCPKVYIFQLIHCSVKLNVFVQFVIVKVCPSLRIFQHFLDVGS